MKIFVADFENRPPLFVIKIKKRWRKIFLNAFTAS
jgi:hypothetical protein